MKKRFYIFLSVALAVFAIAWGLAKRSQRLGDGSDQYSIALVGLPEKLQPWENPVNVYSLVLDAVYYPLISRDPVGRGLSSEFLDLELTKATSADLRKYVLCLKKDVTFGDGSPVENADLFETLVHFHKNELMAQGQARISPAGSCVEVELPQSDPFYLDRFGSVSSTILKRSTLKNNLPTGRGGFRIASMNAQNILLERIESKPGYFNKIVFQKVASVEEGISHHLNDLNHLYQGPLPDSYLLNKQIIRRPSLKTYALFLRIKDNKLRENFAKCFPVEEFRKESGLQLTPLPGFLPKGVLGSDIAVAKELPAKCKFSGNQRSSVIFLDYNAARAEKMKALFQKHEAELPLKVDVQVSSSVNEFVVRLSSGEQMVSMLGLDSSGTSSAAYGEASVYFEPFLSTGEKKFVDVNLPELEKMIRQAVTESSLMTKAEIYRNAQKMVLQTRTVLPLGQLVKDYVYPSWIGNIVWPDGTSEFPRIDLMTRVL